MIILNPSGVATPSAIACTQQVTVGGNPPVTSDKTIKYITSVNNIETVYSGPVTVAWDWIEFRLYDGDQSLDREKVHVFSEGQPARSYEVRPSASSIKTYDGITEPYKISCSQFLIVGNGNPMPSDKTLKYATSLSDEQLYEGEIVVNPLWDWIEFRLYDGDLLWDAERVLVLQNGLVPIYFDLENQHINVPCDSDGVPHSTKPLTTQAILFNGNIPITASQFQTNAASREIAYYPGGTDDLFDPMLGEFYPVRAVYFTISRGTIDQDGIITITELPEDEITATVTATYDGVTRTAILTVTKVRDGAASIKIDIENENTSIACDVDGYPYPEALPIETRAILKEGKESVTPYWWIDTPPAGVAITQDGKIAINKNADLRDVNNILIQASWKNKTYTSMFTVTKVRDGESPVTINLLPDGLSLSCDYIGNPDSLPRTAWAVLNKGTQEITDAMEHAESARVDILHYPGGADDLFDPMLGEFYPTLGYPVTWSLLNAPAGVTIDRYGLITVSAGAHLADENDIEVQALYHGKTHTAIFSIIKAWEGAPGIPGIGVSDYIEQYYVSTSSTSPVGGVWIGTPPVNPTADQHVWVRSLILYEDGRVEYTTPMLIVGASGKMIRSYDVWFYRSSSPVELVGGSWETLSPDWVNGMYMWQKTIITYTDGTTSESAAVCISGPQGSSGLPGPPGDLVNIPEYRGATQIADIGNTGHIQLISGAVVSVNPNDWVAYVGSTLENWQNGHCLRWSGDHWVDILFSEGDSYMAALDDLTRDAGNGYFVNTLTQNLISRTAFIQNLQTKIINLSGSNGIILNGETGIIQSANYNARQSGFLMRASDGYAEFNNVNIHGILNANLQIAGYTSYSLPMVGAIRAIVSGNWLNGQFSGSKSSNIKSVNRLGTGRFLINFGEGGQLISASCIAIGFYSRNESVSANYPGTWIGAWGMILSLPIGDYVQINNEYGRWDYGISFACKDNNSDNLDEDPVRIFVMVVG
jgi:hypothetical protein